MLTRKSVVASCSQIPGNYNFWDVTNDLLYLKDSWECTAETSKNQHPRFFTHCKFFFIFYSFFYFFFFVWTWTSITGTFCSSLVVPLFLSPLLLNRVLICLCFLLPVLLPCTLASVLQFSYTSEIWNSYFIVGLCSCVFCP